ncbi:hypothetical protein [Castellaniella sp.]|uniref:hypothetical protein n=1 Tax=Castellaniella sp. TaxID=1955812 RepID=UPI002AFF6245|nr:hypothetical protein [Castellaniella sp.]
MMRIVRLFAVIQHNTPTILPGLQLGERLLTDINAQGKVKHNQTQKPYIWHADPNAIIAVRNRGLQALKSSHQIFNPHPA